MFWIPEAIRCTPSPWAIANADDATEAINSYIDESIGTYLDYVLDDSNHLV